MAVRVDWVGKPPPDAEEWEDILRAEHGTALGTVEFRMETIGDGWRIASVREDPGNGPPFRIDARQRFVSALRMAGKAVVGESTADDELEEVTVDALMSRTEDERRRGGSGE